jgi:hypothetical protein
VTDRKSILTLKVLEEMARIEGNPVTEGMANELRSCRTRPGVQKDISMFQNQSRIGYFDKIIMVIGNDLPDDPEGLEREHFQEIMGYAEMYFEDTPIYEVESKKMANVAVYMAMCEKYREKAKFVYEDITTAASGFEVTPEKVSVVKVPGPPCTIEGRPAPDTKKTELSQAGGPRHSTVPSPASTLAGSVPNTEGAGVNSNAPVPSVTGADGLGYSKEEVARLNAEAEIEDIPF